MKSKEDLNNKIIGNPKIIDSEIKFLGKNNILYCEDNVVLAKSVITFYGDNNLVYLSSNRSNYVVSISVYTSSTVYIGKNCCFNEIVKMIVSERANIIVGNNCLFATNISFRTADPHLIYDLKTLKRINYSKSIFIGDHVWIGQDVLLLKNSIISSGSIIGAKSLIAGKYVNSNEIWAGNPIKRIENNIFWNGKCVHAFDKAKTIESSMYVKNNDSDDSIPFVFNENEFINLIKIDKELSDSKVDDKFKLIESISKNDKHNRMTWPKKSKLSKIIKRMQ